MYPEPASQHQSRSGDGNQGRKYNWASDERVVIAAVGLDLQLYRGIAFSESYWLEKETRHILGCFRNLLKLTSEVPVVEDDPYYRRFVPIAGGEKSDSDDVLEWLFL